LGVNVVDKTLEPTVVVDLDPVWLANPDMMEIVDGPDIPQQLYHLGGPHPCLPE
jgi:hypothetical protein